MGRYKTFQKEQVRILCEIVTSYKLKKKNDYRLSLIISFESCVLRKQDNKI